MPLPLDYAARKRKMLLRLGLSARRQARAACDAQTLRKGMRVAVLDGRDAVSVYTPHFWSRFYHDGRGPVRAEPGHFLVYFNNRKDDSRIRAAYPVYRQQVKHLSEAQWDAGLAENRARRKAGKEPFMIVRRQVGPARAHPFFREGLRAWPKSEGRRILKEELDALVTAALPRGERRIVVPL